MKHSFFVNLMGLLFMVLGFSALGSVDLAESTTLIRIFIAGFLFLTAVTLLSAGLSSTKKQPVRRKMPQTAAAHPQNAVVFRRAA